MDVRDYSRGAIVSNIFTERGTVPFERRGESQDGYYSKKCGTLKRYFFLKIQIKNWMTLLH